ncbi:DUF4124 domain-containing protein [Litoribrevibacter euphylliae]|uniref:DUF4124 domain-containing protein n=1 Tax=Litoribrevibacter euphylliae TaxID=1834034 RepID=A0ABV7HED9_9GAMM
MKCYQQWMLCFCLLIPASLPAQIYTWEDERGITHFTNQPYSVHPNAKVVTLGVMNYMLAVDAASVDWKAPPPKAKDKPKVSFLDEAKQCNDWRIELASLRTKLKKGYSLKDAKELKNKKLKLRDRIWDEC